MKELVIKDDIFDAIGRTDWYHIEGGELIHGAKEDDGALFIKRRATNEHQKN